MPYKFKPIRTVFHLGASSENFKNIGTDKELNEKVGFELLLELELELELELDLLIARMLVNKINNTILIVVANSNKLMNKFNF